jgi:hypothetical protein
MEPITAIVSAIVPLIANKALETRIYVKFPEIT